LKSLEKALHICAVLGSFAGAQDDTSRAKAKTKANAKAANAKAKAKTRATARATNPL
jgi:hypothetical protein